MNVILSVVLEVVVIAAIGWGVRRRWSRVEHTVGHVQGLMLLSALGLGTVGALVAVAVPPMLLTVVGVAFGLVMLSTVIGVVSGIADWFKDRRLERMALLNGSPPRPYPLGGGWGIAFGLLTFIVGLITVYSAEYFITWAMSMAAIASGDTDSFHPIDPQVTVGALAVAFGLGVLVSAAITFRAHRKIRRWEDLKVGIERRVRAAEARAAAEALASATTPIDEPTREAHEKGLGSPYMT